MFVVIKYQNFAFRWRQCKDQRIALSLFELVAWFVTACSERIAFTVN